MSSIQANTASVSSSRPLTKAASIEKHSVNVDHLFPQPQPSASKMRSTKLSKVQSSDESAMQVRQAAGAVTPNRGGISVRSSVIKPEQSVYEILSHGSLERKTRLIPTLTTDMLMKWFSSSVDQDAIAILTTIGLLSRQQMVSLENMLETCVMSRISTDQVIDWLYLNPDSAAINRVIGLMNPAQLDAIEQFYHKLCVDMDTPKKQACRATRK